jgi:predicted Zn-dependent protease
MTQDRALDDLYISFDLKDAEHRVRALAHAREALDGGPDQPRLLRLMLHAQIADGDATGASDTAARLARLPGEPEALDIFVDAALQVGAVQSARSALSETEAAGTLPPWRLAYQKARIALETGDLLAARAILVMAIDAAPDSTALRALLAEAMVAAGTASDARAVLGHIGRPPANPPPLGGAGDANGATRDVDADGDADTPRYMPDSNKG